MAQNGKKTFEELKAEGFFWRLEPDHERIEPKAKPLVDAINENEWIATYSSCQGHATPPISPYISFYAKAKEGEEFVKCLSKLPNVTITEKWSGANGHPNLREQLSPDEGVIGAEFRFNFTRSLEPKDYEAVLQCKGRVEKLP